MKKIILTSLIATLALTACDKKPTDTTSEEATKPTTETVSTTEEHHDHDHEGHDHAHDHDHHHEGDQFQCTNNKSVNIAVHNHEGEIEAHLTTDDITYDLNQDPNDKKRFTTDEGIEGDGKPMTLVLEDNKAQVLNANNDVLLDCAKS